MRKIIAVLDASIDGVAETPREWPVTEAAVDAALAITDTALIDRETFEAIAAGPPGLKGLRKLVVSQTLASAAAVENSEVIGGSHPLRTLAALKEVPGKDLVVLGSAALLQSLLGAGLLDELQLLKPAAYRTS
ncbi:dihydrofolate reductase family protein [Kribbella sp. CA-293567]|uniref:dihydrofolate reductase family protein n=1 Tax=Kribbella sp. CA-293567 TaxID=3002436 RepID=UPI0022DDE599|nr:dihydrofolate reductase family protein [Kribbella sp. CA-293567]WBQ05028.1 dihydrofolate reductase family protein [Kribbella sp. CA-293567]